LYGFVIPNNPQNILHFEDPFQFLDFSSIEDREAKEEILKESGLLWGYNDTSSFYPSF